MVTDTALNKKWCFEYCLSDGHRLFSLHLVRQLSCANNKVTHLKVRKLMISARIFLLFEYLKGNKAPKKYCYLLFFLIKDSSNSTIFWYTVKDLIVLFCRKLKKTNFVKFGYG